MQKRELYQYKIVDHATEKWRTLQIGIDLEDILFLLHYDSSL